MIQINQHIFDLANRRVALVDLAADEFARPGAPRHCRIIDAGYRCGGRRVALGWLSMSRGEGEIQRAYRKGGGSHFGYLSSGPKSRSPRLMKNVAGLVLRLLFCPTLQPAQRSAFWPPHRR